MILSPKNHCCHGHPSFQVSFLYASAYLSLSSLCFVLILLLPFFLSMLPHLNFCFIFLPAVQQTLRFSSVFYLTIPSSTSSSAACHSASTNYLSFQLLIQFASPNPFSESPGQQDIYSPFFHRCLAQSLCMLHKQYTSFFSLILLSSPTPLTPSRCSHLLCQVLAFAPISFILLHCL